MAETIWISSPTLTRWISYISTQVNGFWQRLVGHNLISALVFRVLSVCHWGPQSSWTQCGELKNFLQRGQRRGDGGWMHRSCIRHKEERVLGWILIPQITQTLALRTMNVPKLWQQISALRNWWAILINHLSVRSGIETYFRISPVPKLRFHWTIRKF